MASRRWLPSPMVVAFFAVVDVVRVSRPRCGGLVSLWFCGASVAGVSVVLLLRLVGAYCRSIRMASCGVLAVMASPIGSGMSSSAFVSWKVVETRWIPAEVSADKALCRGNGLAWW
eukprot:3263997-Amphidinium_carterae.2